MAFLDQYIARRKELMQQLCDIADQIAAIDRDMKGMGSLEEDLLQAEQNALGAITNDS